MPRTPSPRVIKVFIASPGDLAVERRAFKEVIEELNTGFGDGAGVKFEALGWEDALASTGRRSQAVINEEIKVCDVFVLTMNRRWGQDAPDSEYSSYTEEEFHLAYGLWKTNPKHGQERRPEIFVFFRYIDQPSMADPGPHLQKVLDFRRQLEESREVLYKVFADETEFRAEIDRHLRAYAKDELPKADAVRDKVILPLGSLEEIQKERTKKEAALKKAEDEHKIAEAAVARSEELALGLAQSAAKAALVGLVEQARQDFAKATDGSTNLRILHLAYDFYKRTSDLAAAEEILGRWLAISGPDAETQDTAVALGSLGLIYKMRGDLDKAQEMHHKALAIEERLGRQEGMANNYGNLGNIYQTQGDLDQAEEMYAKVLAIDETLGRKGSLANAYGNLGNIYQTRGDLDQAEEMYAKVLAIDETLGRNDSLANVYGNLGNIYQKRGDYERANVAYNRSLTIFEMLGSKEGIATQICNLGELAEAMGDWVKARDFWLRSGEMFAKSGMRAQVAKVEVLLSKLPDTM